MSAFCPKHGRILGLMFIKDEHFSSDRQLYLDIHNCKECPYEPHSEDFPDIKTTCVMGICFKCSERYDWKQYLTEEEKEQCVEITPDEGNCINCHCREENLKKKSLGLECEKEYKPVKHPNRGKAWRVDDKLYLRQNVTEGFTYSQWKELASELGRTPYAIQIMFCTLVAGSRFPSDEFKHKYGIGKFYIR